MSRRLATVVALGLIVAGRAVPAQAPTPVASFRTISVDTNAAPRNPSIVRVTAFAAGGVAASGLALSALALGIVMNCGEDVGGDDEGYCGALDHPPRAWAVVSLAGAALGGAWAATKARCTKRSAWTRAFIATAIVATPTFVTRLRDQKAWLAVSPLASLPLHANLQARCAG